MIRITARPGGNYEFDRSYSLVNTACFDYLTQSMDPKKILR